METLQEMILEMLESFTQEDLERLMGVDQSSISKIKNNKLKSVGFQKADAIKAFYFNWKQQKTSAG
ncbi:MAG: helix-turn-helix transcriptional regulator [Gammaproteobacteria bacterium]|jgi:transcriptional regulator with XRE-family HTH domain|uniref:helix-turn-helix domain-containing protein n=1 Tax=Acinetobacter TaxID=469 RepID=UPI0013152EEB|nr:helix-turn-helix transcriptional regulator [Acinetobacter indicus]NLN56943.1 helix-turn-helix transcriptional regulator [Gammaproteobacteria bacterium]